MSLSQGRTLSRYQIAIRWNNYAILKDENAKPFSPALDHETLPLFVVGYA